jgi:phosphatidylserine/phosphatidylglycerophosphate/cardiolipin synthase-like enzyme
MTKEESIQFHIRSNDYFGTLATEIDLLRQDAHRRGYTRRHDTALQRLRDDLMYLQRGFRIVEETPGL